VSPRAALAVAVAAVCLAAAAPPGGRPARSLADLDDAFAASVRDLVRRAKAVGAEPLATTVAEWSLPSEPDRQLVVTIPPRPEPPPAVDSPETQSIWDDFCAARRARAAGLFEHAEFAAGAHDRRPTRDELAAAATAVDRPPLEQRSCEAVRLLSLALRDDPGHERARAALGWVRRGDEWVTPEAARHLDRGAAFDPAFGWMAASRLERYRAGERSDAGRWISAADDDAKPRDVKHGREYHSDHWDVVAATPLATAAAVAAELETTRTVWRQAFGGFLWEPADLERRIAGRVRPMARTPHAAILCADRGQYLAELGRLEPRIAATDGIYWMPTKTVWFHAGGADGASPDPVTVHHEATHQLFAEARPELDRVRHLAGERCGFWAIEAAACYLESLRPTSFGWTVGGRDAGRVPAARDLLAAGAFVPLEDLCGLGRQDFQARERPQDLYAQVAGLADFFMNGADGRYRESFVEYLVRVYSGTADPDTLARLCKRSYADLDDACRRHLSP
jgi:HAMP domain-containing protein